MPQFVIAYDIHDDRRRERVARVLLRYGQRIQLSVFTAWLDSDSHAELRRELGQHLRHVDSLELFPIDPHHDQLHTAWDAQPHASAPVRIVA